MALKLLARDDERRPQDSADLRGALDDVERARSRDAVTLIHQRGYARGRDLQHDLERFLSAASG